jgi:ribosome biogenesis protein MAK21
LPLCLSQVPFLSHFHPSVSLLASQLIDGVPLTGSADLNLNTLIHFLDRFVYRNAKKLKAKGASIMQPAAVSDKTGVVLNLKGPGTGMEVNSKEFWNQNVEDVPVDQVRLDPATAVRRPVMQS